MRVGWGYDAHRFASEGRVLLGGVEVTADRGVEATSDGDVLAHALCDALLGAAALGDLGEWFPADDWQGRDSMVMLREVVGRLAGRGLVASSVDCSVIAESVRVAPHREAIREALAGALGIPVDRVSVKATSTDGMGFTGADQGIAAVALAVVSEAPA